MDKETIIKKAAAALKDEQEVLFAYLYGSVVDRKTHIASDIDIGVFLRPTTVKNMLNTEAKLDSKLATIMNSKKTDLVIINKAPLVIQFNIITSGEVAFSRAEETRIEFETETLYRYFDLKPFLDEEKNLLLEKYRETG